MRDSGISPLRTARSKPIVGAVEIEGQQQMSLPAFTDSTAARPAALGSLLRKRLPQPAHVECVGDDQSLEAQLLLQKSGDDGGRDSRHMIGIGVERRNKEWATITASTPAWMAARKGGSSTVSRRAASPFTTGRTYGSRFRYRRARENAWPWSSCRTRARRRCRRSPSRPPAWDLRRTSGC